MCKLPKVVIVADPERHLELRKALSSLSYDIVATVATADEAVAVTADVVVAIEPEAEVVSALCGSGPKVVAVGGEGGGADLVIDPDDLRSFKDRIWELFRPN